MPDESTPQSTQLLDRRLAKTLCADVAGYRKTMAAEEAMREMQLQAQKLEAHAMMVIRCLRVKPARPKLSSSPFFSMRNIP
ncbi:MAG: hypothetical protein Q7U40_04660 [Desulfatirhabdiaceae bacterium]|nr:hypothetical protein [Desulfatirhabdiaceae bacterium]